MEVRRVMRGGIYTLVLRVSFDTEIEVGALGVLPFDRGYYAYTGSARGPSGFNRVRRHLDVIKGRNSTRRWHIDYLLPLTDLVRVKTTVTDLDLECEVAGHIGSALEPVPRFGCSDCRCLTHLHRSDRLERVLEAVTMAHGAVCRPSGDQVEPQGHQPQGDEAEEG